ncbi:MAG TPA: hypothetical protein VFI31_08310 [Pirellulales bacterium]|nr:hypothetical protein [Pirellulales bacterium]
MPSHELQVKRDPWELDPNFDRCQALDDDGNHLGSVWFESVSAARGKPMNRRRWFASLLLLPLSALFRRK